MGQVNIVKEVDVPLTQSKTIAVRNIGQPMLATAVIPVVTGLTDCAFAYAIPLSAVSTGSTVFGEVRQVGGTDSVALVDEVGARRGVESSVSGAHFRRAVPGVFTLRTNNTIARSKNWCLSICSSRQTCRTGTEVPLKFI
jgi:hypothetical protein